MVLFHVVATVSIGGGSNCAMDCGSYPGKLNIAVLGLCGSYHVN